ncbi:beta-ketoacyl-ACP synthase 3 [Streptomyces sp. CL12]|uniref:beta-ketoacyl-ACP synthase 3 n=2 Tax=Streptomyces TaxID=1883 RepID=UPI003A7F9593
MPSNTSGPSGPAAVLCGLAGWVPPREVTNEELAERLDTDDTWIRTRTGIRRRHIAEPGQATSDLAVEAGRRALRSAGTGTAGTVIVATTTPDLPCPATAPLVATGLGLAGAAAFDVGAVCTGFVYGLATAAGLIAAGVAERVLLIGADTYSTIVDPLDRANAIIFGDGAGAVVLRAGDPDEPGAVGHFDLGSDAAHEDLITVAAGGSRRRATGGQPADAERHFAMRGKEVYRHAVTRTAASARTVLSGAGWTIGDLDHFVPHQVNLRILHSVAADLGLSRDRCVTNVDARGNTAAASIPLAPADAMAGTDHTMTTYDRLVAVIVGLHDIPTALIRPDATLGALDVDSLTTVEISIRIARDLGVTVGDDELEPGRTLAEIAGLVDSRRTTTV